LFHEGQSEEGFCAAALEVCRGVGVGDGGEDDGGAFGAALLDEIVGAGERVTIRGLWENSQVER
jgi:hypothetical protein